MQRSFSLGAIKTPSKTSYLTSSAEIGNSAGREFKKGSRKSPAKTAGSIFSKQKKSETENIEQIFAEKVKKLISKRKIKDGCPVVVKLSKIKYQNLSHSYFVIKESGKNEIRILQQFHKSLKENGFLAEGGQKVIHKLKCLITGKITDVRAVIKPSEKATKGAIKAFQKFKDDPNLCTGYFLTYTSKKLHKKKEVFLSPNMEKDLFKLLIREGVKLDDDLLLDAMKQITLGLKTMHDNGWTHMDVKTENCFAYYNEETKTIDVRLADFDFSEKVSPYKVIEARGSLPFVAPELLIFCSVNGLEAGKKCDIYSLGMVFWEILEGQENCLNFANPDDTNVSPPRMYVDLYLRGFPEPEYQTPLEMLIHEMINPIAERRPTIDQVIAKLE